MAYTAADHQALLAGLAAAGDPKYKKFHENLIPGKEMSYGVRMPVLRALAKKIVKNDPQGYLDFGAPASYEETVIRGIVIASMPLSLDRVRDFLPFIDNWAVCDTFCGTFKLKRPEDREAMWQFLVPLFSSEEEFTARFAAVMFLGHYVVEDKVCEGLMLLESMTQPEYYIRMAVAWAVAECYVKFPQETLPLLKRQTLPKFTQNKSIQKIRESYRASDEDKQMLLQYKIM